MKKQLKRIVLIIITLALILGISGSYLLPNDTPVALVKKIVRDVVKRVSSDNDWEAAKTGEPLYDGGEVRTGSNSLALILFTDGSGLLRVRENSIANIYGEQKEKSVDKNTFVQRGVIGFDVNKQSEDEEFKFTTPTMVASIRGTSGFIKVEDIGNNTGNENQNQNNNNNQNVLTTLVVEKGSIEVQSTVGDKKIMTVTAGESLTSDSEGDMKIGNTTDDQIKTLKTSKATESKKVRFTVNGVTYEVEYFESEE